MEQIIRELLKKNVELNINIDKFDLRDNLLEQGVNSLNIIKLVVAIENRFDIEFDEEGLSVENFKSIENIMDCIKSQLNNK